MKLKYILAFLSLLAGLQFNALSQANNFCKERISETINAYQPTIVPVLTIDGKYLFVSRKLHPDNQGGVYDNDDIWVSKRLNNYSFSELGNIGSPINNKESNVLFSINPSYRALVHSGNSGGKCPFYLAKLEDSLFVEIDSLNIINYYNQSENYFANLSADGKVLFLAVQREDCLGDTDLYISFFDEKEKCFSEPKNLGPKINTNRIESAPFLAYDNRTLYFSSNRIGGLGGLDLYLTRRLDDSWLNWSEPINLGMRVNSNFDDKSIYLTALSDSALIVSSDSLELRHGIYYVCIPKELKPQPYTILCGNIYLNSVANPFKRLLDFSVTNKHTKEKFETHSLLAKPYYYIALPNEYEYSIQYSVDGKTLGTFDINQTNEKEIAFKNKDLIVQIEEEKIEKSKKLIIYFDFNKAKIKESELEKLSQFIKDYKNISNLKIKICGHTDSSGTYKRNEELSRERALIIKNYLSSRNFNTQEIEIDWKAAKEPISTKDEENRRVEVEIFY